MWLINTETLKLKFFGECPKGQYAILSHTWGLDEPSFADLRSDTASHKDGFRKIRGCCRQAKHDKLDYAWIDTCCIDKSSSAELSEAINSMYNYYSNAKVCYAYIADLTLLNDRFLNEWSKGDTRYSTLFQRSRWFERGWTLQELLAPSSLIFFDSVWHCIGPRQKLAELISATTGIQKDLLRGQRHKNDYSIAQRMSWASKRSTTRMEDIAYSLLGIFDVNMPLLYGEGMRAFTRLQENIIQNSNDETIFAWSGVDVHGTGLLASSPVQFTNSHSYGRVTGEKQRSPFSLTNRGLALKAQLLPRGMNTYAIALAVDIEGQTLANYKRMWIFVGKTATDDEYRRVPLVVNDKYMDISFNPFSLTLSLQPIDEKLIYIANDSQSSLKSWGSQPIFHFTLRKQKSLSNWQLEYRPSGWSIATLVRATGRKVIDSAYDLENLALESGYRYRSNTFDGRVKTLIVSKNLEKGIRIELFSNGHDWNEFPLRAVQVGFDAEFWPVCIFHDADSMEKKRDLIWTHKYCPMVRGGWIHERSWMNNHRDSLAFRGHPTDGLRQDVALRAKNGWIFAHLEFRPCRKHKAASGLHWNVILTVSHNTRLDSSMLWKKTLVKWLLKNRRLRLMICSNVIAMLIALVTYTILRRQNPFYILLENLLWMANVWMASPELQAVSVFLVVAPSLNVIGQYTNFDKTLTIAIVDLIGTMSWIPL